MTYQLALQLKQAGFPQHRDLIYCLEDLETRKLRDVVVMMAFNTGGRHVTFDYSVIPEPVPDDWSQGKGRFSFYFSKKYLNSEEGMKYTVYKPTLSELIEVCGNHFASLLKSETNFLAMATNGINEVGTTPEEAVANLYLALNKK